VVVLIIEGRAALLVVISRSHLILS